MKLFLPFFVIIISSLSLKAQHNCTLLVSDTLLCPGGEVSMKVETSNDYSLQFDGISSYAVLNNHAAYNFDKGENFSIDFWMKTPSNSSGSWDWIVSKNGYTGSRRYQIGLSGNRIMVSIDDSFNSKNIFGKAKVVNNGWNHVLISIDRSGNCDIYVNGILDGSEDITSVSGSLASSTPFSIGATYISQSLSAGHYKGWVDALRVWDRKMDSREVEYFYSHPKATNSSLIGRFDITPSDDLNHIQDSVDTQISMSTSAANFDLGVHEVEVIDYEWNSGHSSDVVNVVVNETFEFQVDVLFEDSITCSVSQLIEVCDETVGVDVKSVDGQVKVYPNIFSENLKIQFSPNETHKRYIRLINMLGETVLEVYEEATEVELSTKSLSNGQYVLMVENTDTQKTIQELVVKR